MVLKNLSVFNPNALPPVEYVGLSDVQNGWKKWLCEMSVHCMEEGWLDNNFFQLFIHMDTKELYAIRDYGMYCPSPDSYLFQTKLLPISSCGLLEAEGELYARANAVLILFEREVARMRDDAEYPLFLLRWITGNSYLTWSVAEEKIVVVHHYKKYLPLFSYSAEDGAMRTNGRYRIIPPSETLINALGLDLNPFLWEIKQANDVWYYREPKENRSYLFETESCKATYELALTLINRYRMCNIGYDRAVCRLEYCVAMMEEYADSPVLSDTIENSNIFRAMEDALASLLRSIVCSPDNK